MDDQNNIPLLFTFYFGDSALSARYGASRRLKKWSRLFDQWLDERKRDYRKTTVKESMRSWRRLVRHIGKMPWQICREDIELHAAWMDQEGFAANTINCAIGVIAGFYQWCDDHRVDPACPPGFNPAKQVKRIKFLRYEGACIWSREELDALLGFLKRDASELGKREYAYFLARVSLGVPLKYLHQLRWEQLEVDTAGAWVRWRPDGEQEKLPDAVWQAARDYLYVSGRLDGMQPGKYIFTPRVKPATAITGNTAKGWQEHQPLSIESIRNSLKIYGKRLGIREEKLTLRSLRWTAIRRRMDDGVCLQEMQAFMDSREEIKSIKYKLGRLPELPRESTIDGNLLVEELQLPVRCSKPLEGGEHTTHGFFSRKTDIDAVKAVLAENIHDMQAEIDSLRKLMRGLMEWEGDEAHLVEAYSKAANRLGELVSLDEPLRKGKKDSWAQEFLSTMDELAEANGWPLFSPSVLDKIYGSSADEMGARGSLSEEIATCRLLLRNVYLHMVQGVGAEEYVRLVDLYGMGCIRLARLLKISGCDGDDRLERYLQDLIDRAIREVNQEFSEERREYQ